MWPAIVPGCACVHVCFTDAHAQFMKAELVQRVFALFQKEGHAHYQPSLASLLGKKRAPQKKQKIEGGGKDNEGGKTAVGKAKAKGKAKSKSEAKGTDNGNGDRAALLAKLKKLQGGGGGDDVNDGDPDGEDDEEEEGAGDDSEN